MNLSHTWLDFVYINYMGTADSRPSETERTTAMNLLNDQEVIAEHMRLLAAEDYQGMIALGAAAACAKQAKQLADAEAAYLESLPSDRRAKLIALGRVNTGSAS